ncbi:zinc finger MYM-type protein 6-like [Tachysurus ichikawai]
MQGLGKGVAAFLKAQHPHIYLMGCPCHLIHLAAKRASRELSVNVEDLLVTIYYYLDKSSKRKSNLRDVQVMCNTEVRKILKMASTRWLSLGQCVNHLLQQWDALTVFFENEVNAGKKKKTSVSSNMSKSAAGHVKKSKATPSTSLPATVQPKVFSSLYLCCPHPLLVLPRGNRPSITREMQLTNEELSIGHDTNTFIQSQDIEKRQSVKFLSLKFFISCFPSILPEKVTVDQVEDEFKIYQTTSFEDSILRKRIDEAWRDIGQLKRGYQQIFSNLSAVMLGILVIFHSNADCERVFSLVDKNKTQYRASMGTNVVSALVARKVSLAAKGAVCHMENFSDALLRKAKSAGCQEVPQLLGVMND